MFNKIFKHSLQLNYNDFFIILLFLLFAVYSIFFGIEMMDSGFIISLSKKIECGFEIYRDFDYVRPPISIYFWNLLLKPFWYFHDYVFLISRVLVFIQFVIISYNILSILKLDAQSSWIYLTIITVLSINIFPLMPWHTTDGLFFLSFAIRYLYFRKFILSLFFALLAFGIKQSFLIPFLMLLVYCVVQYKKLNFRENYWYVLVIAIFFIFINIYFNALDSLYYYKSSSSGQMSNFFKTGFQHFWNAFFIKRNLLFLIVGGGIVVFLKKKNIRNFIRIYLCILLIYCFCLPPIFNLYYQLVNSNQHQYFNFDLFDNIFVISIIYCIVELRFNFFTVFLMICIWSLSISWGYNSIILGLSLLTIVYKNEVKYLFSNKITISVIIFIILSLRLTNTYGEENTFISERLSRITNTPIISGIFTTVDKNNYINESKRIVEFYKNSIFVNCLVFGSAMYDEFPNRAVWEYDVESPNLDKDIALLQRNDVVYIIDKTRKHNSFHKSTFSEEILSKKKLIKTTRYFEIYK
ncbi:hypothetical protein HHL23_11705 [Chryseobacterium sp. RP-3-3]|uniref:Glycosyltransferase RgtA/B/C/D-like domain-containing protein n=1 Tax=Chryseobacterium antibioticum TaxID=2728847 RepID=A0A7Y0ANC4_9FLAO|nr:hypothetical protein [Chryseobacterium antibioticum]NML70464.1 hypothetical protein [Chryseobacterium antibioticum]